MPGVGSKNIIPQRRADAIAIAFILIMVQKMIMFQPCTHAGFHWKVMRGIVKHVIAQIPKDKTGKERWQQSGAEQQMEHNIKYDGQRNAHHRRHNQAARIPGVIVMHTMKKEVQAPTER